jgi:hypothetical protein
MAGVEWANMPLSEAHLEMIRASGISAEVAAERGYRTVSVKAELSRLGFGAAQIQTPTLVIPIHNVFGEIALYQARPDTPRIKNGKALKYETPAGARMTLDVPPRVRVSLGKPEVPLFITEGARKADAAASIGLCCISLLGVWNFRGRNADGGLTVLGDWEHVHLRGRQVFVAFDSDVMLKAAVHAALARLGEYLGSRGASVQYIYLPSGPGSAKVGLDDFLAAGRTGDDLLGLASPQLRDSPAARSQTEYAATDHGLVWHKRDGQGSAAVPLTNFTARIVADQVEDDGAETKRFYVLEATLNAKTTTFKVPAGQFHAMTWTAEHLGPTAIIEPGMGLRERARVAIQRLSNEVLEHNIYAHTGWRRISDRWVYLHAGGGIDHSGAVEEVSVALSGALGKATLRVPADEAERRVAVGASFDLLRRLPLEIMGPLLAAAYLAPLREFLHGDPPDWVLWVHGPSGVFKSELTALAQAHFGTFTKASLPASFGATANALERLTFAMKDAVLVVDDYHPAQDVKEAQQMQQTVSRLTRGIGNASGRVRMRADTTLRPDLVPRCVAIASGERLVEGYSNAARVFAVAIAPGRVSAKDLTAAQNNLGLYRVAMAAYIQWLAGRADALSVTLPQRFLELRDRYQMDRAHARASGQLAHQRLALELATEFALECGAMDQVERAGLLAEIDVRLRTQVHQHQLDLLGESPVELAVSYLRSGLASKRVFLTGRRGELPDDPGRWGWEQADEATTSVTWRHRPSAFLIGEVDNQHLLLNPNELYRFLVEQARAAGRTFPIEATSLWKRFVEVGLAIPGEGRTLVGVRTGSGPSRVLKVPIDALERDAPLGTDLPGSSFPVTAMPSEADAALDETVVADVTVVATPDTEEGERMQPEVGTWQIQFPA